GALAEEGPQGQRRRPEGAGLVGEIDPVAAAGLLEVLRGEEVVVGATQGEGTQQVAEGGRRGGRGVKRHGPALASYLAERREGRPVVTDLGRAGPCVHRPHKKAPPRGRFPTGSRYPRAPAHAEVPFVMNHRFCFSAFLLFLFPRPCLGLALSLGAERGKQKQKRR